MNYIDRIFMNPFIDNNGNKILIIDNDIMIKNDLESLKRICYILGEPINLVRTNYVINKSYFINRIKKNPYI